MKRTFLLSKTGFIKVRLENQEETIVNINLFMEFVNTIDPEISYEWINDSEEDLSFRLFYGNHYFTPKSNSISNKFLDMNYIQNGWTSIAQFLDTFEEVLNEIKAWYDKLPSEEMVFAFNLKES